MVLYPKPCYNEPCYKEVEVYKVIKLVCKIYLCLFFFFFLSSDQTPFSLGSIGMIFCLVYFYGPDNPMGSCRAWSVYLTTLLLDRVSLPVFLCTFFSQKLTTALLESYIHDHERMLPDPAGIKLVTS